MLAGVKSLVIQDTGAVELKDLGAQFYLKEDDVGMNRAEACVARLQELNTAVSVTVSNDPLTEDFVSQFQVSIFNIALYGVSHSCLPPHVVNFVRTFRRYRDLGLP